MENKTEEKTKNIINKTIVQLSWSIPWAAGFLYTWGYVGVDPNLSTYSLWKQVLYLFIYYIVWPYILGHKLSGR